MDKVRRKFNTWAKNGKAELMEIEHGKNVSKFLRSIKFEEPFIFLDVGCGNGWTVRKIAEEENCNKAVGIDKSEKMIEQANKNKTSSKEKFIVTDIESMNSKMKFDFIFSMEALYYSDSIENTLVKIYRILKPGGQFFCGTDFYTENEATRRWAEIMKVQMHLHSKKEWKDMFKDAGFSVKTKQIKDPHNKKKWKRELGTLFIIGTKGTK